MQMLDVNWGELGFVALFILYLIYQGKVTATQEVLRQEKIESNHKMWQAWLSSERETSIAAHRERQEALLHQVNEWRVAADLREQSRSNDNQELVSAIVKLQNQIEHMTSIILLVYARVQSPEALEAMNDVIKPRQHGRG
jgi:hypothetical protein